MQSELSASWWKVRPHLVPMPHLVLGPNLMGLTYSRAQAYSRAPPDSKAPPYSDCRLPIDCLCPMIDCLSVAHWHSPHVKPIYNIPYPCGFFLPEKRAYLKEIEKSKSWHWVFERIQDQYSWCWTIYRTNSSNMNSAIADTIVNGTRPRYIVALSPLAQNMLHIAWPWGLPTTPLHGPHHSLVIPKARRYYIIIRLMVVNSD